MGNYTEERYVESGYVESGYVVGAGAPIDLSTAYSKKLNFIVDNHGLDDESLKAIMLQEVGENYENEVVVVFGADLKIAEKVNNVFSVSKVAGGMSEDVVNLINKKITDVEKSIQSASNLVLEIRNTPALLSKLASSIMGKMQVNLVASQGDTITSNLIYNDDTHSYILDYDTTLLDGTDYTIEMKLA